MADPRPSDPRPSDPRPREVPSVLEAGADPVPSPSSPGSSDSDGPAPGGSSEHRWTSRRIWLLIIALVIVSRLVLSAAGAISGPIFDEHRTEASMQVHALLESARHDISGSRFIHQWYSWDALHYENLSRHWPDVRRPVEPSIVTDTGGRAWHEFSWPPLYPVTIAALAALVPLGAGQVMVLFGVVLFAVFLRLLWGIARHDGDTDPAAATIVGVTVAAPLSFFLSIPMTEPLFVVLAAISLLAARQQRWVLSGLAAGAMVWTKMTGVLMVAPLLVAAVLLLRRDGRWDLSPTRRRDAARALWAPGLCAASYAGYLGFAWWLTGTPTAPLDTQRYGWGNSVGNPVWNLVTGLHQWQYLIVLAGLALMVALWRAGHLGLVDATFCLTVLLSATMVSTIVAAAPRYAAVAFPLWIGVARWATARGVTWYVIGGLATAQIGLFVLWSNYWLTYMF